MKLLVSLLLPVGLLLAVLALAPHVSADDGGLDSPGEWCDNTLYYTGESALPDVSWIRIVGVGTPSVVDLETAQALADTVAADYDFDAPVRVVLHPDMTYPGSARVAVQQWIGSRFWRFDRGLDFSGVYLSTDVATSDSVGVGLLLHELAHLVVDERLYDSHMWWLGRWHAGAWDDDGWFYPVDEDAYIADVHGLEFSLALIGLYDRYGMTGCPLSVSGEDTE